MTFNHRLHGVLKSMWEISSQCWPGSLSQGGLSASREWLRRFLLLKLVTVLLFPNAAGLPLLVGCVFSLQTLILLRSPHISTKPSTVLLGQLALADGLLPLQWVLRLVVGSSRWMDETMDKQSVWWREAIDVLAQQLLHAHHLASLLLLGLLGLEATLVSRWPQQTRRFRTSHWAQLSCGLVWTLVLLELACLVHSELQQNFRPQDLAQQDSQASSHGQVCLQTLPLVSLSLRRMLWLGNSWLHYVVFNCKPKRRRSTFH